MEFIKMDKFNIQLFSDIVYEKVTNPYELDVSAGTNYYSRLTITEDKPFKPPSPIIFECGEFSTTNTDGVFDSSNDLWWVMVSNSITSDYHIDRRYYYKYPTGYTDPMINGWQIDVGSRDPVETTSVVYLKTTYAMGDFPSGIGFCISLEKGSGRYSNLRVYVTNKPDLSGDPITSLGLYKEIEIYHNIIAFDNIGYVFRLRLQPWHITDEEITLWF